MGAIAQRAALARDSGAKRDEVLASAPGEHPKMPAERVRLYAERVFTAPVPAYLAAAEAYSACLGQWAGAGDLALSAQRIDFLTTCTENAAPGGAVACGYAEILARRHPPSDGRAVPVPSVLDAVLADVRGSIVVVRTDKRDVMGVVAPGGEFVIAVMGDTERGQKVSLSTFLPAPEWHEARVAGVDPESNIATIEPPPPGSRPVTLADPNGLDIGQPLMQLPRISSPPTARVVTLANTDQILARVLRRTACWPTFVETVADASTPAIAGPVFDLKGDLVTMGAMYYEPKQPVPLYPNFGYSAGTILQIAQRVQRYGYWKHGSLGLVVQEVTSEYAKALGLSSTEGALVHDIDRGSPANRAGVRLGDVILAIDGERLLRSCQLPARTRSSLPGDVVRLTVRRGKTQLTINVTAQEPNRASKSSDR